MIFSSIPFLYKLLPVALLLYYAVPSAWKNSVLLMVSLFFYGYGEPKYLLLIGAAVLLAYLFGLLMGRADKPAGRFRRLWFWLSVCSSLSILVWFKYADFFVEQFSALLGLGAEPLGIALPLGVSFYTFQILSYTIDVYHGKVAPQRNLVRFAMYVTMFPQLIAGPIVIYAQVEDRLDARNRRPNSDMLWQGARRFVIGLGKKVLLANELGALCVAFSEAGAAEQSVLFHWLYAIGFTLQIYFDFSGYSDMAIGLGKLLGFSFPENFDYPYAAKSITAFWRRWHITLGRWFREYVYIPLGGNRVSTGRWIINLLIVWGLTGLWHGAAWTFVLWGLVHGLLLLNEKLWLGRYLAKWPSWAAHVYTCFAIALTMVLFHADSVGEAATQIGAMFGFGGFPAVSVLSLYALRNYGCLLVISVIAALPIKNIFAGRMPQKLQWLDALWVVGLLLLSTAYLVDGSYNPFLYFRF